MSIPTGVIPASLARLILGQSSMGSGSSILGVYLSKVARSSSIQYYLQHIEVYILIVIHTYNIEPFASEVKRFGKKDSTNLLHYRKSLYINDLGGPGRRNPLATNDLRLFGV
jgi:hypothetical protein